MAAQQGGAQQARRGAPQAHAAEIGVAGDQRFGGARAQDGQVGQPLASRRPRLLQETNIRLAQKRLELPESSNTEEHVLEMASCCPCCGDHHCAGD